MSIEGKKDAYKTCEAEFDAEICFIGSVRITTATAFLGATEQYIEALEQRVKDLETILKVVNEPAGRDVTAELGHVRGLDVLQWLYGNWRRDVSNGVESDFAGIREFWESDILPLECLINRGYANREQRACWITVAGREYLKALKHELNK